MRRVNFHYPMTFAAHISCFCAEFSFDFVTLTFDLLTLAMSGELFFTRPMHIPIFSILQLSVPELCVTQYDHITFTWNGHCAYAVSCDLYTGGPPKPHVTFFWPRIIYSLSKFYGVTIRIKGSWRFCGFSEIRGSKFHIELSALPYPERRVLTYFA